MIRKLLPVLLLCSFSAIQAADKIVGGPLVVNVDSHSATVVWVKQSGEVKLGEYPGFYSRSGPALHAERVGFTGLQSGTTYYYDLDGTEQTRGSFKTAPIGKAKFLFVVYGDTRTRHGVHKRVVDAIAKINPDFIIHTGDLVRNGKETTLWPLFFTIENELLHKTVFYPVLGNHERNSRDYYEFFDVKSPYYSFDWGTAHFTMLNSDMGNAGYSEEAKEKFWAEQIRWMEADLEESQDADFRFVAMHHPPFTAVKKRHGGNKEVTALVPYFEKYNVTAVFGGHDHNYQHHLKNGIHYVVTGGGGAPLYPVDGVIKGLTKKVESVEHYVRVKVDGSKGVIEAIALDGHLIDRIELGK